MHVNVMTFGIHGNSFYCNLTTKYITSSEEIIEAADYMET